MKKFAFILLAVFATALIGLIVWDFENIGDDLPRIAIIVLGLIGTFVKLLVPPKQKGATLETYNKAYSAQIGRAFSEDRKRKKKLLTAIKLYNTEKYQKAEKELKSLYDESTSNEERRVTGLFLALTYTDWGFTDKAVQIYEKLIEYRIENETVCNNLAQIYNKKGKRETALKYFNEAIRINPEYDVAYTNIANIYLDDEDYDKAKEYGLKAFEINNKLCQTSNLLAIVYHIDGDRQNAKKYFRISVKNGANPNELKAAMEFYRKLVYSLDEIDDEKNEE